jgi:hypothetical protein
MRFARSEEVICTYTNTKKGKIIVVKDAVPNDPANFTFTAGGGLSPTSFQLDDDSDPALSNTRSFDNLTPGNTYSLSEANPASLGFYLARVSCDDGSPPSAIDVQAGETVTCTFVNSRDYPKPATGTPFRVPLVVAYDQCTSPNTTHAAPKLTPGPGSGDPACDPPVKTSDELTTSAVGRQNGFAKFRVAVGNESTPADEANIAIDVDASDVLRQSDGSDYVGPVLLRVAMRITDRSNNPGGVISGTVQDTDFSVPVNCLATPANPSAGSRCSVSSTVDTFVPNFAKEGKRAVISALSVKLLDAGPNGTIGGPACAPACGDGDEQTYLEEGVFHF